MSGTEIEQAARDYVRRTEQCTYHHADAGICLKCGWCADSPIIWLLQEVDRLRGEAKEPPRNDSGVVISSIRRSAVTNRYVTNREGEDG